MEVIINKGDSMKLPSISTISGLLNIFDKLKNYSIWIFKNRHKFKKSLFFFKNYHKHVTIYENGNGIVINSFDIVFNDTNCKKLARGINIDDGKISAKFKPLKEMRKTLLEERFDKYGFWVYSEHNIIKDVKEEYWLDDDKEEEDKIAKNNPKELRWVFTFNKSKINLHKPYHVVYIISIPGMFPIKDGKLDNTEINKDVFDEYSISSIETRTPTENLIYTLSFYNNISLQTEPEVIFKKVGNTDKNVYRPITNEYNIIYNKYMCCIKSPQIGSKLKIRWKFKGGNE